MAPFSTDFANLIALFIPPLAVAAAIAIKSSSIDILIHHSLYAHISNSILFIRYQQSWHTRTILRKLFTKARDSFSDEVTG